MHMRAGKREKERQRKKGKVQLMLFVEVNSCMFDNCIINVTVPANVCNLYFYLFSFE